MNLRLQPLPLLIILGIANPTGVHAEDLLRCGIPEHLQSKPLPPVPPGKLLLESDSTRAEQGKLYEFSGNVSLVVDVQHLRADQAQYDFQKQHLQAQGAIRYQRTGLVVLGETAELKIDEDRGAVTDAEYMLSDQGGRGVAHRISVLGQTAQLSHATYTTCANGEQSWQLSADSITLDRNNNEGTARGVKLEVSSVPVLYLPYISFALEGRKSGFLPPSIGYSSRNGADITAPYYLNLAPHRDATLLPRIISERGLQLGGEFRYLNANNRGQFFGEYLPNDQVYDGKDRSLISWRHEADLSGTLFETRYDQVSDMHYFKDLGTGLSNTNQTQLDRHVKVQRGGKNWSLDAVAQDYQMLSNATEPYRRLPQINYRQQWQWPRLDSRLHGQYTFFQHDDLRNGQRVLLEPEFSTGYRRPGGYATTRLLLHSRLYELENTGSLSQEYYDINTYAASLDSGLYFTRRQGNMEQTLEPRLYYLYSPARSQNHLPNFDTGALDVSLAQLFRDFRYSGGDRWGDDQRLSLGLTSRFIDLADGRNLLRLSLAQANYFADQRVTLPGEAPIESGEQRLAAELGSEFLPNWQLNSTIYQNPNLQRPEKAAIRLNYATQHQSMELAGRYRRNTLKQVGTIVYARINAQWRLAGRWIYSLLDDRSAETVIGAEYGTCCWNVRLIAQEYLQNASGAYSRNIGIQIELTGLASVGDKSSQLTREIMGYRSEGSR